MTMSPEQLYYFLGQCLTLDEFPDRKEEIRQWIRRPGFPWEQFVGMGSTHLVLPALYVRFRNGGLLGDLPGELTAHLKHLHALSTERNRQLREQITWLHSLFEGHGIGHIFLKGSASLLDQLYPDEGERVLHDIDCLVGDDLSMPVALLESEGYSAAPFDPASLPLMHHYPALFKPGQPAQIELHRIPVGRRQLRYLGPDLMNTVRSGADQNQAPRTPTAAEQILLNVIHSQLKDRGQYYGTVPLRSAYEFYRLTLRYDPAQLEIRHPRLRMVLNNYQAVGNRLFRPDPPFPEHNTLKTSIFLFRFHLNRSNRTYYRFSKCCRSAADLLGSYLYVISGAIRHRSYRKYLFKKLTRTSWYRHHLSVIRKRFSAP